MRLSRIKRINESAYFVIDFRSFTNTLTPYDPIIANQTISFGNEGVNVGEYYEPIVGEFEQEEDLTLDRIVEDPQICMGEPTIKGARITVAFVKRLLKSGMQVKEVLEAYPQLDEEDIKQALAY